MKAIPTIYKGVQFRSRLEARWAAFFDLLGWRWHYEPIDLDGWIPDFVLGDDLEASALVEVKPIDWMAYPGREGELITDELEHARRQLTRQRSLVVCGLRPVECHYSGLKMPWFSLGYVWDVAQDKWWMSRVREAYDTPGFFDIPLGCSRPYLGMVSGQDFSTPEVSSDVVYFDERSAWAEAGNRVQWKKPV